MDVEKIVQKWKKETVQGYWHDVDVESVVEAAITQDRKEREINAIEDDDQYEKYLNEAKSLMDVKDADSPKAKRLKLLASLIENYEYHRFPELWADTVLKKISRLQAYWKEDNAHIEILFLEENVIIRKMIQSTYSESYQGDDLEDAVDAALEKYYVIEFEE